jgi:two-component system NarL family response regulator
MSATILLVDDHQLVRKGLRMLLEREVGLTVVGEAGTGTEGLRLFGELRPDVVVLDIHLPDIDGLEVARRLLSENPAARVVILSGDAEVDFINEALLAGVKGYILKSGAEEDLVHAIRAALSGKAYLCPEISTVVLADYRKTLIGAASPSKPTLSAREREVLKYIAHGLRTKETAAQMGVGVKTAETYRRRLMRKLGYTSIAELTRYAIREGIASA